MNDAGDVINTIMATGDEYMAAHYGDRWSRSVVPAPPPPAPEAPKSIFSKYEFLKRFTSAERKAINAAAKVNADIEDFKTLLDAAQEVDCGNQDTVAGVNALEAAGILAAGRAAEILAP